jgi:lipopolysaccharide transport system ATP-binding protein
LKNVFFAATPNPPVLDVQNVWKVYCRNLKRGMWYGLRDLGRELVGKGRDRNSGKLRPGEFYAIRDASFSIDRGECVAMIGPNGAGKSTMLKMINGLIKPNAGTITIRGKTGALIELGTGFNPILSGRENIYINATILGLKKREIDRLFGDIVEFSELGEVIDDPVKTYSTGMRLRLGFAVAANLNPDLLIMDEVLAVGDVGFRMKCFAHLRKLVDAGVAIIVVSHAVPMLQRVATRTIVFGQGKIVHDGDFQTGSIVYEELMKVKQEQANQAQLNPAKSSARFTRVSIFDDSGQPRTEFQTGDSIQLRLEIDCDCTIRSARLIAALNSPVHGVVAAISTAYQGLTIDLQPGISTYTLRLEKLPLLIGSFHFNVSLFGPETEDFYHRLSYQTPFRILGPETNADGRGIRGIVKIDHSWNATSPSDAQ